MLDLAPAGYEPFAVLEDKPLSPDGGGVMAVFEDLFLLFQCPPAPGFKSLQWQVFS